MTLISVTMLDDVIFASLNSLMLIYIYVITHLRYIICCFKPFVLFFLDALKSLVNLGYLVDCY